MIAILSPEDSMWVRAIAQRAVVERGWTYVGACTQAYQDIVQHYEETDFIPHDDIALRLQRLIYENETDQIVRERDERRREEYEYWNKRRAEFKKKQAERDVILAKLQPEFDKYGGRNRWIHAQYLKGKTLREIGEQTHLTTSRISGIIKQRQRHEVRWWIMYFKMRRRQRPIDMGGPRDVWLTYTPTRDPRRQAPHELFDIEMPS
jgi:hypothetical protein